MKKLILAGLTLASTIVLNTQTQPVAEDHTFYTTSRQIDGDLAPFVQGGTPPYMFYYSGQTPNNGFLMIDAPGTFSFSLNNPEQPGSFGFHVIDSNNVESNNATITIEPGSGKEKLK